MAKNQESINRSLFELLRSRGYAPTLLDTSGKEIPVPEEAEVFQFKFTKDGEEYGTVTTSIDGLHKLIIYFGDDVANSAKGEGTDDDWFDFIKKVKKFKKSKLKESSGDDSWYKLLNHLKRFAQQHQLSFEVKNRDHLKYDMAKREHMKKQEKISEGYYPMGKKASYNDNIPTVKIVIEHSRTIEEGEQRYRNVNRIFLENTQGERILAPTTKPGVAQIYARHLAEGGMPHDDRWNHIIGLCEEYNKMGAFVRATRNNQFNESAQQLVNEGINHYQSLRESLSKMRGARGYNAYFESYTPPLMEDESEENNLNELFVQETLDPRIESVMPILSKLHKKVAEMKEVNELSEWADSLTEIALEEGELGQAVGTAAGTVLGARLGPAGSAIGGAVGGEIGDFAGDMAGDALGIDEEVDEGILDTVKKIGSKVKDVASTAFDKLGGGTEEDLIRKLQQDAGVEQTGKKPEPTDKPVGEGKGILDRSREQQAANKIEKPAVHRKEEGGNWKVTPDDLKMADEKNMTSSSSMAALKKNLSNIEEVDMGQADSSLRSDSKQSDDKMDHFTALGKASKKMGHNHFMDVPDEKLEALRAMVKRFRSGEEVDESALQNAGREGASEKTKQNIRAEFSDKEKPVTEDNGDTEIRPGMKVSQGTVVKVNGNTVTVKTSNGDMMNMNIHDVDQAVAEGEFAGDYATGEAGQWRNKGPKANKPATIGDLVGEGEEKDKNDTLNPWKHVNPRVINPKIPGTDKHAQSGIFPPLPSVKRLATPYTKKSVSEGLDDLARILNIAGIRK